MGEKSGLRGPVSRAVIQIMEKLFLKKKYEEVGFVSDQMDDP